MRATHPRYSQLRAIKKDNQQRGKSLPTVFFILAFPLNPSIEKKTRSVFSF